MSTKCTIKYGDGFHFYDECFDDDNVYLQLDEADVEMYGRQVTLAIPKAVWAVIRESAPVELPYAKMKDSEIEAEVTKTVDERIAEYKVADEKSKPILNFMGSLPFGGADSPREEQIARGIEYYSSERRRQKRILNQIRKYQRDNKR